MARKRGFFAELQHQARVAEQQRLREARAAEQAHAAAIRRMEAAQKKAAAAQARARRAAEADRKRAAAEAKKLHQEARLAEVEQLSGRLDMTYEAIDSVLQATLEVDDFVDLTTLRTEVDHPPFPRPDLETPTPLPDPVMAPPEPTWVEPEAPKGLKAAFGKKRFQAAREQALAEFQSKHAQWQRLSATIPAQQLAQMQQHQKKEAHRLAKLESNRAAYEEECRTREANVAKSNAELDELIANLGRGEPEAVNEYVSIVLANSVYPEEVRVEHDYSYDADLRELDLIVTAPEPSDIPAIKAYRYVKANDEITTSTLSQKAQKDRYNGLIHQLALRSAHEIFEADRTGHIETISLLVQTATIDPATGQPMIVPFVALAVDRPTFEGIDLALVEPPATLDHLGAQVSKNPHGLVPIDTSKGVRG